MAYDFILDLQKQIDDFRLADLAKIESQEIDRLQAELSDLKQLCEDYGSLLDMAGTCLCYLDTLAM